MNALILAAGDGTRLRPLTEDKPKVMIKIWNVPILERLLYSLKEAGIKRAIIVVGYKSDKIIDYFGSQWRGIEIVYRKVDHYEDGILSSAVMGDGVINERFVFVCGDTILEPETIKRAIEMQGDLVVGVRNERIVESVGALVGEDNRISNIGMQKEMKEWNRIVTGVAVCEPSFLKGIRSCVDSGDLDRPSAMQWVIDQGYDVRAFDMTDDPWWELDNHEDLDLASKEIFGNAWKKRFSPTDINIFKRIFNLPVSLPLTKLVSKTNLKPFHLTLISLVFALLACASFIFGYFIIGGIFSYACAMADAVDGKIARLKLLSSKTGSFFDSVIDRISEISIVAGLTYGTYTQTSELFIFLLGFFAILGWLGRFYLKELFINKFGFATWKNLKMSVFEIVGHRDVSFFIIMVSCFTGHIVISLLWMAILGNILSVFNLLKYFDHLNRFLPETSNDSWLTSSSQIRKIIETNSHIQTELQRMGDSGHDKACAEQI
ncbi:MAG: sugar phosphate nucleotidyltransferase [Planctomycetota bacterium]|jgi:choline kinase/phosphatidylglycerophosphate synthase